MTDCRLRVYPSSGLWSGVKPSRAIGATTTFTNGGWINRRLIRHSHRWRVPGFAFDFGGVAGKSCVMPRRINRLDGLPPSGLSILRIWYGVQPTRTISPTTIHNGGWINRRLIRHGHLWCVRGSAFDFGGVAGMSCVMPRRMNRHDGLPPSGLSILRSVVRRKTEPHDCPHNNISPMEDG
ncbi:hypothetical protein SAMN05216264_107168 [Pseudomonas marincola]|nr:hypothetical protein SAMN05216264_107168 [Pseudomonas marincola]